MAIFIILVIAGFAALLLFGRYYKSAGTAEGVCTEVKTEFGEKRSSAYSHQMHGVDNRMYRPYVKYTWEGREYVSKSFAAYSTAKYFPGDRVLVAVHDGDKDIVKILRPLGPAE